MWLVRCFETPEGKLTKGEARTGIERVFETAIFGLQRTRNTAEAVDRQGQPGCMRQWCAEALENVKRVVCQ